MEGSKYRKRRQIRESKGQQQRLRYSRRSEISRNREGVREAVSEGRASGLRDMVEGGREGGGVRAVTTAAPSSLGVIEQHSQFTMTIMNILLLLKGH